jgi:hypothetical protein
MIGGGVLAAIFATCQWWFRTTRLFGCPMTAFRIFEYLKLVFLLISHIFRSLCFLITPFSRAWFPLSLRRYSFSALGFQ